MQASNPAHFLPSSAFVNDLENNNLVLHCIKNTAGF